MSSSLYRFRIVGGPQSGHTFTVSEEGALIGRAENSDVIILDPAMSRHHCRIFYRDGLLWVADLKSANDTLVDNVPIQEAPLWKDRRITIGETVILVESDTASLRPLLTSERPYCRWPKRQHVAIAALLIVLLALFVPRRPSKAPPPTPYAATPATEQMSPAQTVPALVADYYRASTAPDTLKILHFLILPSGYASIRLEDLTARKELRRTAKIPTYQLELLAAQISESGFFSFDSTANDPDGRDQVRISLFDGTRIHTVTRSLDRSSAIFRRLCDQIEETAAITFGDWVKDYSDENLIWLATRKYETAMAIGGEQQPDRYDHLFESLQLLADAQWLCQYVQTKPAFTTNIPPLSGKYRYDLDAHLRSLFSEADRAAQRGDSAREENLLQLVLKRIPDNSDVRYRTAAGRLTGHQQAGHLPHNSHETRIP